MLSSFTFEPGERAQLDWLEDDFLEGRKGCRLYSQLRDVFPFDLPSRNRHNQLSQRRSLVR